MKRDAGDILDRFSIAYLKSERIGNEENKKECEAFEKELVELAEKHPNLDWVQIKDHMLSINDFIWQLEAGLKSGKEKLPNPHYIFDKSNEEVLSKIGTTTILIRNFNHLRVGFKNLINKMLGEGFQDIKKDHLSEGE